MPHSENLNNRMTSSVSETVDGHGEDILADRHNPGIVGRAAYHVSRQGHASCLAVGLACAQLVFHILHRSFSVCFCACFVNVALHVFVILYEII